MGNSYDRAKAVHQLKMPKKFELEHYLSLSTQELLDLLSSARTTVVFRTLCAISLKNLDDPAFLLPFTEMLLKNVIRNGVTFKNRKMAYNLYAQLFPDQIDDIEIGASQQIGFVYFLQEKRYGSIKIGRSLNLDLRLSNFVTDLPYPVELIGYVKSINYEMIELSFHKHFHEKRLGGEWFALSNEEISDLRDSIFPQAVIQLIVK